MEEDVLGPQQDYSGEEYVACGRCGAAIPRVGAVVVPADALEDHSEFGYLCRDCELALADGEQDLPTTPM